MTTRTALPRPLLRALLAGSTALLLSVGLTAPASATTTAGSNTTAASTLETLPVKGRAAKTGYSRDQFGPSWKDVDRNGCDTRNDILVRDLVERQMSGRCKVMSGVLYPDPYTGTKIIFTYGKSKIDIDHVVALGDVWVKGGQKLTLDQRTAIANDPLNLLAVDYSANRQKGDSDAATWLPSYKPFRCDYVARQIAVKKKYNLWVTAAEKNAMKSVLSTCPNKTLPTNSSVVVPVPTGNPTPAPTATPAPKPSNGLDPQFSTCGEAVKAGYGPYVKGQNPEYDWYQDRDGDGVVCES